MTSKHKRTEMNGKRTEWTERDGMNGQRTEMNGKRTEWTERDGMNGQRTEWTERENEMVGKQRNEKL